MEVKLKEADYITYGELKHNETFKHYGKVYIKLCITTLGKVYIKLCITTLGKDPFTYIEFNKGLNIKTGELEIFANSSPVKRINLQAIEI